MLCIRVSWQDSKGQRRHAKSSTVLYGASEAYEKSYESRVTTRPYIERDRIRKGAL